MASPTVAVNHDVLQPSSKPHLSLEMAAAHALLASSSSADADGSDEQLISEDHDHVEEGDGTTGGGLVVDDPPPDAYDDDVTEEPVFVQRRPRSDSAGLDALADLASMQTRNKEDRPLAPFLVSNGASSSDSDDSEAMPPPPPRRRRRSASNPEGMEKWDSLRTKPQGDRRHFVLPASILEEELAEVSEAMKKLSEQRQSPSRKTQSKQLESSNDDSDSLSREEQDDDVDEASLSPEELLRRARSRLLEDLSTGNLGGEKGESTFPHLLKKYKEVSQVQRRVNNTVFVFTNHIFSPSYDQIYSTNGRIGIYTPAERAAIIARFQRKRSRRVWNKKIRYGCRKSLADRRIRVKGRFVKRSEQELLAKQLALTQSQEDNEQGDESDDKDMPDVGDADAGFAPTEDSPYRRLRRYTIT